MLNHLDALIAFIVILLFASLLVTVITQIVMTIFNLRGRNLFWGLNRLLNQVQPGYDKQVEEIVEKILTYPLISKSRRLANVIRVEELEDLLMRFAKSPDDFKLSKKAKELVTKFNELDYQKLTEQLAGLPDNVEQHLKENINKAYSSIQQALQKCCNRIIYLENWFDNIADRMSERFTFHSRLISVAAALVIATSFQLDSIDLMQKIYTDRELRTSLVATTEKVLTQGKQILGQQSTFDMAMDSLQVKNPAFNLAVAPLFSNRPSAKAWIFQQIASSADAQNLVDQYVKIHDAIIQAEIQRLQQEALSIVDQLDQFGLKIISANYSWNLRLWGIRKYFGIIISIVLLSLGAPFWFNILKNLVNLRSKIMRSEEKERESRMQK